MRIFPYLTVGRILEELKESFHNDVKARLEVNEDPRENERLNEILDKDISPITRATFYRIEKRLSLQPENAQLKQWRKYSREEADIIKNKINEVYKLYS